MSESKAEAFGSLFFYPVRFQPMIRIVEDERRSYHGYLLHLL